MWVKLPLSPTQNYTPQVNESLGSPWVAMKKIQEERGQGAFLLEK